MWRDYVHYYVRDLREEMKKGFDLAYSYAGGDAYDAQVTKTDSIAEQLVGEMHEGFTETGEIEDGLYYYGYFNNGNIHCFHAKTFTRKTKKNIKKKCKEFGGSPFRITFETENIESDNIESNRIFTWGEFSDNNFPMFRKHTRGCYKFNDRDTYYVYCSDGKILDEKETKEKNTLDYHYNHLFHNKHSRIFNTKGKSLISSDVYYDFMNDGKMDVDNIRTIRKDNKPRYLNLYNHIENDTIYVTETLPTNRGNKSFKNTPYGIDEIFIFAPLFGYNRWIKLKKIARISTTTPEDKITLDQFQSLYLNIDESLTGKISYKIQDAISKMVIKRSKCVDTPTCKKKWKPWITEIYNIQKSGDTYVKCKNRNFSIRVKNYPNIVIDFLKTPRTGLNKDDGVVDQTKRDKLIPKKINATSLKNLVKKMETPAMQCQFLLFLLDVEEDALCFETTNIGEKLNKALSLIEDARVNIYREMSLNDAWKLMLNEYITFKKTLDEQLGYKISDNIEMEKLRFYTIKSRVLGKSIQETINMFKTDEPQRQKMFEQMDKKMDKK